MENVAQEACGHLAEQREEQRTSENRNHVPCHIDTTQEGQPCCCSGGGLGQRRVCMLCHMQWVSSLRGSNTSFTAVIIKANLSVSLVKLRKSPKYLYC